MNSLEDSNNSQHGQSRKTEALLFFISGIGSTLAWTAVLSNLVFYTAHLGEVSYIYLNLAVYIPLIPISFAQARWDSVFDRKYKSLNSFLFRGSLSYALAVAAIILTPRASNSLLYIVFLTLTLGTSSAVLQGALKQMAAFVYKDTGLLQAAVSSGMQGSSIAVLIVALSTGFGDSGDPHGFLAFNYSILGMKVFCWVTFYWLMTKSSDVLKSMQRRDTAMNSDIYQKISPVGESGPLLDEESTTTSSPSVELDYWTLTKKTAIHCTSLTVTLLASMLVGAYLNRVPSADPDNVEFAQVLFYAKMIPDVLGRPFTILMKPKSEIFVLSITLLRLIYLPIFLIYTLTDILPRSDFWITLGLAVFSFFSGYIVTATYQLAPDNLSEDEKSNTPKQANVLNIVFSSSVLGGLLIGLILLLCIGEYQ